MANITMCQCPCHLPVWMGIYPPVCTCQCGKVQPGQQGTFGAMGFPQEPSGTWIYQHLLSRINELEEWTRKDEDRIYERIETLERHLKYQLANNEGMAKHIAVLDDTIETLITKIADIGNFYYREKDKHAESHEKETRK